MLCHSNCSSTTLRRANHVSIFFGFVSMCAQNVYRSYVQPFQQLCRAYLGNGMYTYLAARIQDVFFYNLFSV